MSAQYGERFFGGAGFRQNRDRRRPDGPFGMLHVGGQSSERDELRQLHFSLPQLGSRQPLEITRLVETGFIEARAGNCSGLPRVIPCIRRLILQGPCKHRQSDRADEQRSELDHRHSIYAGTRTCLLEPLELGLPGGFLSFLLYLKRSAAVLKKLLDPVVMPTISIRPCAGSRPRGPPAPPRLHLIQRER